MIILIVVYDVKCSQSYDIKVPITPVGDDLGLEAATALTRTALEQ